jgi:hypothetical protein
MKEAVSRTLYAYWNGLRGDRVAPKRFEIEPSCIAGHLPDTFILERIDAGTLRFRLAGTRICEAFGVEFRGVNLFQLFDDEDIRSLQRQIAPVMSHGAVAVIQFSADSGTGLSASFELVLMPLMHMRDAVDRFLGCIVPIDKPKWLGTVPLTRRKLTGHETVWPAGHPPRAFETAHRQTPFLPVIREAKIVRSERRQFRVYEGGLSRASDE